MSDLFDKGHHSYIDNWYTSEKLLNSLRDRYTVACGTAMGNRIKAPKSLKDQPLEIGEWAFWSNVNLLMVRYKDKKEIFFLSTIHDMQTEWMPKRERDELAASKLKLVNNYNTNMGGVDRNDALIGNCTCVRKSFKWTVKVAMHYVEEAVLNSFILYDKINLNKMRFMNFKLDVIEKIIIGVYRQNAPNILCTQPSDWHSMHTAIDRHFLELIPRSEKKEKPQKRCQICHEEERRKETRYQCKNCSTHPGLCPASCFEKFHSEWKFCRFSKVLKDKIDIKDGFFTVDFFFYYVIFKKKWFFSGFIQHNSVF